jgi:hypothetical protein
MSWPRRLTPLVRPVLSAALATGVIVGRGNLGLPGVALLLEGLRGFLLGATLAALAMKRLGTAPLGGLLADSAVFVSFLSHRRSLLRSRRLR